MVPFVELASQFRSIEPEIRAAIDRVFARSWFVLGEEVEAFEGEFAAYTGAKHAVGVGSGTEALHLALLATGVRPGDEVITVANTCVPTVAAIAFTGARTVLVDVEPDTLTMDAKKLAEAITPKTRAIVPVHLYGQACAMDAIMGAAGDVPVIEDCAQAHGARFAGRHCGTFGLAGAFSFYPSKNLGAYGDAGAIVTDDGDVAARLRMLRNYGEQERYHHAIEGFNSRLDELHAAMLRTKLGHLDAWNERRRSWAALYCDRLSDLPLTLPREAPQRHHVYHVFVVRTPRRDGLRAYLREREVGTQLHYPVPIHLQQAYSGLGYPSGAFPVCESACNEVLSLPLYPELLASQVEEVATAVHEYFEEHSA